MSEQSTPLESLPDAEAIADEGDELAQEAGGRLGELVAAIKEARDAIRVARLRELEAAYGTMVREYRRTADSMNAVRAAILRLRSFGVDISSERTELLGAELTAEGAEALADVWARLHRIALEALAAELEARGDKGGSS